MHWTRSTSRSSSQSWKRKRKKNLPTGTSKFEVDTRRRVKTAFDDVVHARHVSDLKWFGNKYAFRKRKARDYDWGMRRIQDCYDDPALEKSVVAMA